MTKRRFAQVKFVQSNALQIVQCTSNIPEADGSRPSGASVVTVPCVY